MSPRGTRTDRRPDTGPASPPAERHRRSRWRDPRLVVGLAVVAVCALLGARLLGGGASDTVSVWAARGTLEQGQQVGAADVVRREVRFADQGEADRYLSADHDLPTSTLARPVGAGELLPRGALGTATRTSRTEVPLSVDTERVPATIAVGSTVDVWVTPDEGRGPRSTLVFDDVRVVSAPRNGTTLGPTATRQVIVGVGADQEADLPRSIAALSGGTVVLTVQR